jgi:hypothetical protein
LVLGTAGYTNLTRISIPNSVTKILEGAFCGCTNLTSITVPRSVTTIYADAFSECTGLTNVTILNGDASIGTGVFCGCPNFRYATIGVGAMLFRTGSCPTGEVSIQATIDGLTVTHLVNGIMFGCELIRYCFLRARIH